jgi:hypothetical protein
MNTVVIVLIAMLLAASASAQPQFAGVAAACGPKNVTFDAKRDDSQHSLPQLEPRKAQLVVIQDVGVLACLGGCITTKIGVDGAWVGALQHSSYFSLPIDPGEHHVCANRQLHFARLNQMLALAHFTAESGKVYYLRTRTFAGRDQSLMDLDQVDIDEGRYFVSLYPLSVSHPKP